MPSVPETATSKPSNANAPESGLSNGQAPNDKLQDALESFGGNSFLDLLRTIEANTEDPDEKEAVAELIALIGDNPDNEEDFMRLAIDAMIQQTKEAILAATMPTFPTGGVFSTSESPLPESDQDRAARVMANALAELEELKEQSRQRGEAAGVEPQEDRRNK